MKMKGLIKYCVVLSAAGLLAGCGGAPSKDAVKEAVKKIMPVEFEISEVKKLDQVPGLYEVVLKLGNQSIIFYTDKKAKYIVSGSIVEVDTKKNLTMERQMALNPQMMQHQQEQPKAEEPKQKQKKK
ncbi:MAG: hypothetical protein OHK0040_12420 [bacterium]